MKKNSTNFTLKMLAITLVVIASIFNPAFCQAPNNDVNIITLDASSGQPINFRLPKDIRSGDVISGTVVEERKTSNSSSRLEGMVIEIDGKQTSLNKRILSFTVPAGLASIPFLLKNAAGDIIDRGQVPVIPSNISYLLANGTPLASSLPSAQSFFPEAIAQPGQPLRIAGFFDGNASNTDVSLNGKACELIAESPRGSFVAVPENVPAGNTNITISENNHTEEYKLNIIHLDLSAGKTDLRRGEKTTIHVAVTGLEGLDPKNELNLSVDNLSPSTISFLKESNTAITKEINAGSTKNGVYEFSTRIVALTAGSFTIAANITNPNTGNPCVDAYLIRIAEIRASRDNAIEACNKRGGIGNAVCVAKVTAAAENLEKKAVEEFKKCQKENK